MKIQHLERVENMPSVVYHSHGFTSASQLKKIASTSLAHFKHERENPKEQTPALIFGSAYHTLILEPEKFADEYFTLDRDAMPYPDKDFRNSDNKAWKEDVLARNSDKTYLSPEDFITLYEMKAALELYPNFIFLLKNGVAEESYFAEIDGMGVRVRPDYVSRFGIVDLKTCQDASPEAFGRDAAKMRYLIQAALYTDVVSTFQAHETIGRGEHYEGDVLPFFFLAQEKTAPYIPQMYRVPSYLIEAGRAQYEDVLKQLFTAQTTDVWQGYEGLEENDGIRDLQFPVWALKGVEL